jgi:protein-arginine kinase activator protein McsA
VPLEVKLKDLKEKLARAVHLEEYETAAKLRDEIKQLESAPKK